MTDVPRSSLNRRTVLRAGLGAAGGLTLPGLVLPAHAADHPPVGTWPAGVAGDSVFIGI